MNKENCFYCLAKNNMCKRSWFGRKACTKCEKEGDCRICGRQETSFCEKCVQRTGVNNKALVTSE